MHREDRGFLRAAVNREVFMTVHRLRRAAIALAGSASGILTTSMPGQAPLEALL